MILLVLVVGTAGILGVVFATGAVSRVTEELAPADASHAAILQDLTDIETSVRGWAITGNESHLQPYYEALDNLPEHESTLAGLTEDDPRLGWLVQQQQVAADDWLDSYPKVRLQMPTGPDTFEPKLFESGKEKFDRLRSVNADIAEEFDDRILAAREKSRSRLAWTVFTVALVVFLGAVVAMFFGRLTGHEITVRWSGCGRWLTGWPRGTTRHGRCRRVPARPARSPTPSTPSPNENERVRALEPQVVEQLRDLDRAKGDFLSNVSHELRTPLTSIGGYVELFEDDFIGEITPAQAGMLLVIKRNVERLKALIEDLLTLSRAESEAFRTAFDMLDLSHLTSDAAYDMQAAAAERDITIAEVHPEYPMRMLGDSGQLSRALLNLVSNVVKFSHDGGEVTIRPTRDDGCAVIEVVDRGIGVPDAEIPKLATLFFRASNAVDAEITGLGLRIVQTIADNHGGRLGGWSRWRGRVRRRGWSSRCSRGINRTSRVLLPGDQRTLATPISLCRT